MSGRVHDVSLLFGSVDRNSRLISLLDIQNWTSRSRADIDETRVSLLARLEEAEVAFKMMRDFKRISQ